MAAVRAGARGLLAAIRQPIAPANGMVWAFRVIGGPNRYYGGWGSYGGPAAPTFWVWGPSAGAFDYPCADWRGPTFVTAHPQLGH
jgi:hypothetical protein